MGIFMWVDELGASQRGTFFGVVLAKKKLVS
jgi:hypothetical protein